MTAFRFESVKYGSSAKKAVKKQSDESRTTSKMDHVRSKTRSFGQNLEKPCVRSRGHIFSPILMKLDQKVCLGEVLKELENRSCRVKTRSLCQIFEKRCVCSREIRFSA